MSGEPSYQQSVQQTGKRSTPDVAFDGDPNTGVHVYSTDPVSDQGSWQVVGGTSLGAPAWAGIVAIVDQGRALAGNSSLDGPTQLLPSLYAAPSSEFNTVSGSSVSSLFGSLFPQGGFDPFGSGVIIGGSGTTAGATANTSTGLGSPVGSSLIPDLVASTLTRALTFVDGASTEAAAAPVKLKKKHAKHHKKHAPAAHGARQKPRIGAAQTRGRQAGREQGGEETGRAFARVVNPKPPAPARLIENPRAVMDRRLASASSPCRESSETRPTRR